MSKRTMSILAALTAATVGGVPTVIAQTAVEQSTATQAQELHPDAIAIAERIVDALGGRERIAAIQTLRVVTHEADQA